jgi:hypothetical protein
MRPFVRPTRRERLKMGEDKDCNDKDNDGASAFDEQGCFAKSVSWHVCNGYPHDCDIIKFLFLFNMAFTYHGF